MLRLKRQCDLSRVLSVKRGWPNSWSAGDGPPIGSLQASFADESFRIHESIFLPGSKLRSICVVFQGREEEDLWLDIYWI